MKEVEEQKQNKEKEIDLLEVSGNVANSLKKGIVLFFTSIWNIVILIMKKIVLLFRLAIHSWKFIALAIALLVGISFYLFKSSEAYYISEGQVISRISNSPDIIQIVNSISIPNDESPVSLNNDLNLEPSVYNNIISINASWLIDLDGDGLADIVDYNNDYKINRERDSLAVRMKNRFNISLKLKDQRIANTVQDAVFDYLINHPYVKDINDQRVENFREISEVYEQQAEVLDSLQNYEYFVESKLKNTNVQSLKFGEFELIGSDPTKDKRLYHSDIIELKNEVIKNTSNVVYEKDPIVFIGTTSSQRQHNNLTFYAKKVFLLGIPLFFILFLIVKHPELEEIFKINEFLEK